MIGFVVHFDDTQNTPKYIQLYEHIKHEILRGKVEKGEKLPSIRVLCDSLKISKSTAENAYQQLVVEGYIESRLKSGYYVSHFDTYALNAFKQKRVQEAYQGLKDTKKHIDLEYAEEGTFNFSEWKKALNRVLEYEQKSLLVSGEPQGEYALRVEISKFIHQSRGGSCHPDQIIIGAGVQILFGLIAALMKQEHRQIAFEYPGFAKGMYIFEDYGYDMVKIPVECDGIHVKALEGTHAKLVYVSPSHQYPTGSVMPIRKRLQLLSWASRKGAYIIEDDYDSLLRYEGYPVPALQGMNQGENVIYVGSFSKLLMPSLRISFLILPQSLMSHYEKMKLRYSQSVSKIDQLALAHYMREGAFERHIRRIKKIYGKKNQLLIDAFKNYENDFCKLLGRESGLHVVLSFHESVDLELVVERCGEEGIHLELGDVTDQQRIVIFPYSNISDFKLASVVKKICQLSKETSKCTG